MNEEDEQALHDRTSELLEADDHAGIVALLSPICDDLQKAYLITRFARSLRMTGEPQRAVELVTAAIDSGRYSGKHLAALASARVPSACDIGPHSAAVAAADFAISVAPTVADAHYWRAQADVAFGTQTESGRAASVRAVELEPENPLFASAAMNYMYTFGRPSEAKVYAKRILAFGANPDADSGRVLAHVILGLVAATQMRMVAATLHYRHALLLKPDVAIMRPRYFDLMIRWLSHIGFAATFGAAVILLSHHGGHQRSWFVDASGLLPISITVLAVASLLAARGPWPLRRVVQVIREHGTRMTVASSALMLASALLTAVAVVPGLNRNMGLACAALTVVIQIGYAIFLRATSREASRRYNEATRHWAGIDRKRSSKT